MGTVFECDVTTSTKDSRGREVIMDLVVWMCQECMDFIHPQKHCIAMESAELDGNVHEVSCDLCMRDF